MWYIVLAIAVSSSNTGKFDHGLVPVNSKTRCMEIRDKLRSKYDQDIKHGLVQVECWAKPV